MVDESLYVGFGIDGDPSDVCVQLVVHETGGEDIAMARSLSVLTAVTATWIRGVARVALSWTWQERAHPSPPISYIWYGTSHPGYKRCYMPAHWYGDTVGTVPTRRPGPLLPVGWHR